jgi:hypothetical protein
MVLHLTGFSIGFTILLLPILDLSLKGIVILLHFRDNLLVLIDFNLIVLVVVDFTIKL